MVRAFRRANLFPFRLSVRAATPPKLHGRRKGRQTFPSERDRFFPRASCPRRTRPVRATANELDILLLRIPTARPIIHDRSAIVPVDPERHLLPACLLAPSLLPKRVRRQRLNFLSIQLL